MLECDGEREHPRGDDVGEDTLVLSAVAGELLDPLRGRGLDGDAPPASNLPDLRQPGAPSALRDDDLVHVQVRIEQDLVHGVAAVDRDEAVFRGDLRGHRVRIARPSRRDRECAAGDGCWYA